MSYISEKYTKGTDLVPLIRNLEANDIPAEELDMMLQQYKDGKDIPTGIVITKSLR